MSKLTFEEIKARKKPPVQSVYIITDDELAEEYARIESEYSSARLSLTVNATPDANKRFEAIEADFDEVQDRVKDNSLKFTFKALNRRRLEELMEELPPTAKQKKQAKELDQDIAFDTDKFPPALLSASLIEPKLSVEEATELWNSDDWTQGELLMLFNTSMEVNQRGGAVNFKRG